MGLVARVRGWVGRRRALAAAGFVLGLALFVFGIVYFEPHKLFVDDRVDEAFPSAAAGEAPSETTPAASVTTPASPAGPAVLSSGRFRPLEHDVEGRALVLETPEGDRFLRFEDLNLSNGPDLKVYLSVLGPDRGWYDYDDDEYVSLGDLKGNIGDQNYALAGGLDLSRYRSVVIWCERFSVGFAVAPISGR